MNLYEGIQRHPSRWFQSVLFSRAKWKFLRLTLIFATALLIVDRSHAEDLSVADVVPSERFFRDPPDGDGPTVVSAAFRLRSIDAIDDEAETFQFNGVLTLKWKDPRRAFDPSQEEVEEKIYQGAFQFLELSPAWYPQVVLANASGMYEKHGVLLRVEPDGSCTLIEAVNGIAETKLEMRRYPLDTQNLKAVFAVLGFDRNEVELKAEPTNGHSHGEEVSISQWQLVQISTASGTEPAPQFDEQHAVSTFTVTTKVERKSFFIVRLAVVPLALMVVLSWSVFWMERSSLGDRINISFVGILSAVAYQIVVGDILPHISYFTLMHGFVNLSLFTMSATVVVNLVVGAYDKKGMSDVGDRVDYRCRWIFPVVYFGLLLLATAAAFTLF